jgi:hypothetical protein
MSFPATIDVIDVKLGPDGLPVWEVQEFQTSNSPTPDAQIFWGKTDNPADTFSIREGLVYTRPGRDQWRPEPPRSEPVQVGSGKYILPSRGNPLSRVVVLVLPERYTLDSVGGTPHEHVKISGKRIAVFWQVAEHREIKWKLVPVKEGETLHDAVAQLNRGSVHLLAMPDASGSNPDPTKSNAGATSNDPVGNNGSAGVTNGNSTGTNGNSEGVQNSRGANNNLGDTRTVGAPEGGSTPVALWERVLSFCAMFWVIFIVSLLVLQDRPLTNPNYVVLVRILLSLAAGTWGATIPGMFSISAIYRLSSGWKTAIRASGAICFFLVTFFGTPQVLGNKLPVRFEDKTVKLDSVSNDLTKRSAVSNHQEDQRLVDQRQTWKGWLRTGAIAEAHAGRFVVIRASFTKSYLPFHVRLLPKAVFTQTEKDIKDINDIASLDRGVAFLVGQDDQIMRQLDFVIKKDGNGQNPGNDNDLKIEEAGPETTLLMIVVINPKLDKDGKALNQKAFEALILTTADAFELIVP